MPIVNVKRFSRSKIEPAAAETPVLSLALPQSENNSDDENYNDDSAENDNLFQDLGRSAFEASQIADERAAENAILETKRQKEIAKAENEMAKKIASMQKKAESKKQRVSNVANTKTTNDENDDSVFSDQGSEILGRDKRQLITKVVQYKQLFPQQLKTFKVKKNANAQELRDALQEMEVIVQTSSLDEFVIDSILATLKLVEGVSSYSTYSNISGLSEMLRLNPQFNSLVKQLYIKYNTFSNVPPEQQLAILVITSAYVCVQKNKNRAQIDAFLNEPVLP